MCRVILMNKQGEKEIEKIYGLDKYLKYLEKQLGGHGNGFALLKNRNVIKLEKGVNLDVRDIADTIRKTSYDWCVFHTRLASIGKKSNENCHPFRKDDFVLAMNGTEKSVSFVSEIKDITDTEAILDIIDTYHFGLTSLRHFNSIFMGFFKGKPFVVADNTISIKILRNKKNKALVFASDFPTKFRSNIYETTDCFIWNGGRLPNTLEKCRRNFYSSRTVKKIEADWGYPELYGQCYMKALEKEELGDEVYGI